MTPSLVARRSSLVALLICSATARANCPNTLDNSYCHSVCAVTSTTYDCNVTNPGATYAATAYAVSDFTAGYHSVWGVASDGNSFCCEVDGSTVDTVILTGSDLADYLYFYYGNDDLDDLYGQTYATINGGDGDDTIGGSRSTTATYDETLNGDSQDDTINGNPGDDIINGNTGQDIINGGDGVDIIHGNDGGDTITGGAGNDLIWGDNDIDYIGGGDNDDTVRGGSSADEVCGDDGNDDMFGEAGDDLVWGGAGTNTTNGGIGTDACGTPWLTSTACESQQVSKPTHCP